MKKKINNIKICVFVFIFVITCGNFLFVLMGCWGNLNSQTVPEFLGSHKYAKRGYAVYVELVSSGPSRDVYDLYDEKGKRVYTTWDGGNITSFHPEYYLGCTYVCYYDSLDPSCYFICFDSMTVGSDPIYKTVGYIMYVNKWYDIATITIRWKTNSGKWQWIEQAVSSVEFDKFRMYKKSRQPIDVYVYKTSADYYLAQVK